MLQVAVHQKDLDKTKQLIFCRKNFFAIDKSI